ncbi:MAG: hypothetical protein NT135_01400 [Candidatus Berkelbacteria bacterium]|nr:hypothetical protein [Candidatus Berkelbacteria bacterium]
MGRKLHKIFGLWWEISIGIDFSDIFGPYCPNCFVELKEFADGYRCENCNREIKHPENILIGSQLANKAIEKYKADIRSRYEKISLDEPPTAVKVRDQDDKYFLAAKIGQKDGRRVGVVYFGEKNKEQSKEDYSQIFIDLDDEQLRFDKSNKHPKEILANFNVTFKDTSVEQKFSSNFEVRG